MFLSWIFLSRVTLVSKRVREVSHNFLLSHNSKSSRDASSECSRSPERKRSRCAASFQHPQHLLGPAYGDAPAEKSIVTNRNVYFAFKSQQSCICVNLVTPLNKKLKRFTMVSGVVARLGRRRD